MPGPPPSTDPVRRNSRVGPLRLPAEGRNGPPPAWPLPGRQAAGVKALWEALWSTPQAVAWQRLGWTRVVARYCLVVAAAESDLDPKLLAQATTMEDRLGLTPKAMRMLLWEVVTDEVAEKRQQPSAGARGRIKAVG